MTIDYALEKTQNADQSQVSFMMATPRTPDRHRRMDSKVYLQNDETTPRMIGFDSTPKVVGYEGKSGSAYDTVARVYGTNRKV